MLAAIAIAEGRCRLWLQRSTEDLEPIFVEGVRAVKPHLGHITAAKRI
jgi:hypothetical protein